MGDSTTNTTSLYIKKIYPLNRMNNNQNNGSTIILLLIIMMISSSISSVGAVLGFNLVTTIKPSGNVKGYINQRDARIIQLSKETGVDGIALKNDIIEQTKKACLVPQGPGGKCPEGTKPMSDGCCAFENPKAQSSLDMIAGMAPDLAIAIIGGLMTESLIIAGVNAGVYARTGANTMGMTIAKTGAGGVGTRAAGGVGTRAAAGTGARAAAGVGTGARAAAGTGARAAAGTGAKMGAQVGVKVATQTGTRFAVAMACGPICLAITVATAVFTIALDITDPFGYNNFAANEVIQKKRNAIDVMIQKEMLKENISLPLTFPLPIAFPEYSKEFEENMIVEFLPDALELMPKDLMIEFFTNMLTGKSDNSKKVLDAFDKALDLALANTVKRDNFTYDFYRAKGKSSEIEKVPFMATKDRIGVTLSQKGADNYNKRMRDKHLVYSNPHKNPPATIPEDYTPMVAVYTDTYRVINQSNPGSENSPNVIEKKLASKVCLAMPYGMLIADCEYGFNATKHSQRLNPAVYGVKFNYERGDCDFTGDYCKRLGLKLKNNECKLREGQKEAELILGKTVTRTYMEDWDNRIEAWESGDPGSIVLATITLPFAAFTPWINKGIAAIKDTVGRGVGTPMVCGPDKERKGELCYPKCRTGPGGETLYKSRALECEGTCPDGTTNTGFTCLQSIHSYIPGQKKKGIENLFTKSFWERADCRTGYQFRGTTCNEECKNGFKFRSGAAGSAFCDKPRNRYSRAGDAKVPDKCPEGKVRDASLCYEPCKPGYRGNGPTCKKSEESKQKNPYKV